MSLEIWIPETARGRRLLCTSCGSEYPLHQRPQFERHVIHCDRVHEESERLAHEHINEGDAFSGRDEEALEARERALRDGTYIPGMKGFPDAA